MSLSGLQNLDLEDLGVSPEIIQHLLDNIDNLDPNDLADVNVLADELTRRQDNQAAQDDLIEFCKRMQPDYIVGKHHRILADMLMAIEAGDKDRICVNIPPRHGKSQLVSIYFPAWFLGRNPTKKVMMVSHTTDLAVDFGRKVRNLLALDEYKSIFPDTALAIDSKSAGRWNTNKGGEYYACGVGSALAGRGADLLLIDDPHSEQDVLAGNFAIFDKAYEWYTYGARTRLMPGGRVAIIQTRWHMDDLTGRVVKDMTQRPDADQFEIVEFPALLKIKEGTPEETEKPLWPEFFDLEALLRTKNSMPLFQWNAQYQQKPTAEEASIVKREWWRRWEKDRPPPCEFTIMSLDAAAEKNNRADFTSLTRWGIFVNEEEDDQFQIIVLDSIKKRLEFPELKQLSIQQYLEHEPDAFIVEKKSSGTPLFQELRRMGIPVSEFTPHRGTGDKTARLNSVADIFSSGLVWAPQKRWADEVIEEVAGFPFMSNDDIVDTTIMALLRFRQGGFVRLPSDLPEPEQFFKGRRAVGYY